MNTEFQIFRWGIPGWIFLLTYSLFELSVYDFSIFNLVKQNDLNNAALAGIAAIFVALGVPIGYLIYQVYFWFKWTFGSKEAYLAADGIEALKGKFKCNVREDWSIIETHLDSLMSIKTQKKEISYEDLQRRMDRYSNRTSRTHGLGASMVAMALGFLIFMVLNGFKNIKIINFAGLFVFLLLVGMAIYSNYYYQNISTFRQINSIMKDINDADENEDTPAE